MEGRVFSELRKTVVLSRHGAGIISSYKLYPEQELVIRNEASHQEIEARVVGQIGADGNTYIYGIAFLDGGTNFGDIDFPDLSETEKRASQTLLECSSCHARETADHSDLASDVLAINKSIVRYCQKCGSSTLWRQPVADSLPAKVGLPGAPAFAATDTPPPKNVPGEHAGPSGLGPSGEDAPDLSSRAEPPVAPASWREGQRPSGAAERSPTFAGAAWTKAAWTQPEPPEAPLDPITRAAGNRNAGIAPASEPSDVPTAESSSSPPPGTRISVKEQENRRRHARTRISLKACVRRPGLPDDVVACEDLSRGGLRFKSTRKYFEKTLIDVAVPYSPGDQAIFVPAQIAYVQELREQKMYRCGVTYLRKRKIKARREKILNHARRTCRRRR